MKKIIFIMILISFIFTGNAIADSKKALNLSLICYRLRVQYFKHLDLAFARWNYTVTSRALKAQIYLELYKSCGCDMERIAEETIRSYSDRKE